MKKSFLFVLILAVCASFHVTAFAAQTQDAAGGESVSPAVEEETAQDSSQPRFMVTSYKLSGESVTPEKPSKLSITFKNYSKTKAISNIKLAVSDDSGELKVGGMGTKYVEKIKAGGTYVWEIEITAAKTAAIGTHKLSVTAEFEDKYYTSYSSSDVIDINVRQSVSLDYDGVMLPSKIVQDETVTIDVNLMNTGKSALRNCKLDFAVDSLESGGSMFIGEIPAGESKTGSANLRAASDITGEVSGTITLSYEDEFGEKYTEQIEASTVIEEKPKEVLSETEEEKTSKYSLWWLFLITGAAAGGGLGFAIPAIIRANKQRKEDEMRL